MARRTKISFTELVEYFANVIEVEVDSDMLSNSRFVKPEIVYDDNKPVVINLGFIALNDEDKFYSVKDGGIKYSSLDDGTGSIHIITKG